MSLSISTRCILRNSIQFDHEDACGVSALSDVASLAPLARLLVLYNVRVSLVTLNLHVVEAEILVLLPCPLVLLDSHVWVGVGGVKVLEV